MYTYLVIILSLYIFTTTASKQSLDNNELEDFPVGILELSSLTQLWLRQNKISKLPLNLDCLQCLEILSVSSNALDELPDCLRDMNRLILSL